MPETDLLALCPEPAQGEFEALFNFAVRQGVAVAEDRSHYARRFATDQFGTRREIDFNVATRLAAKAGKSVLRIDVDAVRGLPGYPKPIAPRSDTSYPESWL
jgi:hypothetical protein